MKKPLLFIISLLLLCGLQTSAQTDTTKKEYPVVTYKELSKMKSLEELAPESLEGWVAQYEVTLACDGHELSGVFCTGKELCPEFFKQVEKYKPARCLYHFDRIQIKTPSGEFLPAKGFVIEIKVKKEEEKK